MRNKYGELRIDNTNYALSDGDLITDVFSNEQIEQLKLFLEKNLDSNEEYLEKNLTFVVRDENSFIRKLVYKSTNLSDSILLFENTFVVVGDDLLNVLQFEINLESINESAFKLITYNLGGE